ncbi:MAG: zinc-ribbon domain-containing protein [Solirubrobacterales bacterium]
MDFFEKIGNMTKNAMDKTGEMIEINGIRSKISTEEAKISAFKGKIGEYYWNKYNEGTELDEEASNLCLEIKNSMAVIEGFNMDIEKIKANQTTIPSGKFCKECGAKAADGVKFCSECGAKIE